MLSIRSLISCAKKMKFNKTCLGKMVKKNKNIKIEKFKDGTSYVFFPQKSIDMDPDNAIKLNVKIPGDYDSAHDFDIKFLNNMNSGVFKNYFDLPFADEGAIRREEIFEKSELVVRKSFPHGPGIKDLMRNSDAWEKSLRDTILIANELCANGKLSWKTWEDSLSEHGYKSFFDVPPDGKNIMVMRPAEHMGRFYLNHKDGMQAADFNGDRAALIGYLKNHKTADAHIIELNDITPEQLINKLKYAYMHYNKDEVVCKISQVYYNVPFVINPESESCLDRDYAIASENLESVLSFKRDLEKMVRKRYPAHVSKYSRHDDYSFFSKYKSREDFLKDNPDFEEKRIPVVAFSKIKSELEEEIAKISGKWDITPVNKKEAERMDPRINAKIRAFKKYDFAGYDYEQFDADVLSLMEDLRLTTWKSYHPARKESYLEEIEVTLKFILALMIERLPRKQLTKDKLEELVNNPESTRDKLLEKPIWNDGPAASFYRSAHDKEYYVGMILIKASLDGMKNWKKRC